jgi:RHS repeat-associated protein
LSKKDALNYVTSYVYDSRGNIISIVEPNSRTSYFEYDQFGNQTKVIDALGHIKKYEYDINGNSTKLTTYLTTSSGLQTLTATKAYNRNNLLTSATDTQGHTIKLEYNSNNKQIAVIDAIRRRTEYRYDVNDQLVETIYPDGTPSDLTDNIRMKASYDVANNKLEIVDPLGRANRFKYDALNRTTDVVYPDNTPSDDSDNQRIVNQYDQLSNLTRSVDNLGVATNYQYDALGRVTTISNFYNGHNIETKTTYDAMGRETSATDALGRTTKYIYDALNRLVETKYADGFSELFSYDAFSNTLAKTDRLGRITRYEYDALNRMTTVIDALGYRTEYQYDELGNLVYQKDANVNITRYEYDTLGRQTAVIRPMGQRETIAYDSAGRISSVTDFNGQTISYEYDDYDHIKHKFFIQTGKSIDFEFSPSGKIKKIIDENGATTYSYNPNERLTSQINPDGKRIDYTYDSTGQLIALTTSSGTTNYQYDELARLSRVTSSHGLTEYSYDDFGNLISTKLANGIVESRAYNLLNQMTSLIDRDISGQVVSSYSYTYDRLGNRTKVLELNDRQVEYTYDELMRLTSEKISDSLATSHTINYTYDSVGNRLSRNDSISGLTAYSYDPNNRLTIESSQGINTTYGYDLNGNNILVNASNQQTNYSWDQQNRLTKIDIQTVAEVKSIVHRYDFNGNRIATVNNGQETRYLVDTNRSHAQVLEDYEVGGQARVSYVYGLDLISEHANNVVFYLKDGHSGVRQLSNGVGQVTHAYDYDAYGRLLSATSGTENNYGYQVQRTDSDSGLQYLRARYYNPNIGRFASIDPRAGSLDSPVSQHRYLYANDNPVTFFDPSGETSISLTGTSVVSSIISTLSSIATPATGLYVLNAALGLSALAAAATIGTLAYDKWRNLQRGVKWDGTFTLTKIPAYGVQGNPSIAIGEGSFSTPESASVMALGRSFTIGDLNPLKLPSYPSKYEVSMYAPDVSKYVGEGTTNKGVFLGPFIFSNLKFTFPGLLPDELLPLQDVTSGVLVLGFAVGTVTKTKPLPSFQQLSYSLLRYDPFEYGFVFGVSTPVS